MTDVNFQHSVAQLLFNQGCISHKELIEFTKLSRFNHISADGSQRQFFRVMVGDGFSCVGVLPNSSSAEELAESHTSVAIGRHLFSKNVPVPEIIAADAKSGLVLFEDCGDCRLHDLLLNRNNTTAYQDEVLSWYKPLLLALIHMQVKGADGFDPSWCHDSSVYDKEVMLSRESGYFLEAFWSSFLGGRHLEDIHYEFEVIAEQAGGGMTNYFLHRDFQCRNVMIKDEQIKIIDFQGGRYGPPGYDLASLLTDPYAKIDVESQEVLLRYYIEKLGKYIDFDEREFLRQYSYLKLQRNLQIIGAFAFLYGQRRKQFFKAFIAPALEQLYILLHEVEFRQFSQLQQLVREARKLLDRKI